MNAVQIHNANMIDRAVKMIDAIERGLLAMAPGNDVTLAVHVEGAAATISGSAGVSPAAARRFLTWLADRANDKNRRISGIEITPNIPKFIVTA